MTVNNAGDSLTRLICALEREVQRVETGQMSEPQRYVSLLFAAFQDQSQWLDAVTMLRSRMEELERRYDRGSAFDKKRECLLKELSSLKVECRPAAVNEADAQFQLDVWCEALSGKYVDRISADPAQAARELQEAFEDWRLVKPTENSLRNVLIELKEAATENALTPMRGIVLLLGCLAMPDLTLLSVERLCSAEHEEYGPTVHEILAIVQWISASRDKKHVVSCSSQTQTGSASGDQPAEGEQKKPPKGQILAYYASNYAESKLGAKLSAEEIYDFWRETGFDQADCDMKNSSQLASYELPTSIETFKTYLSKGRAYFKDPRNRPRKGRRGRSVISQDELD